MIGTPFETSRPPPCQIGAGPDLAFEQRHRFSRSDLRRQAAQRDLKNLEARG